LDSYQIVVEIDGAQHTEDPPQRWDEMEHGIDPASTAARRSASPPGWYGRTPGTWPPKSPEPSAALGTRGEALGRAGYTGHSA